MLSIKMLEFHENIFFYFIPKFPKEKQFLYLHPEASPKVYKIFFIYLSSKNSEGNKTFCVYKWLVSRQGQQFCIVSHKIV